MRVKVERFCFAGFPPSFLPDILSQKYSKEVSQEKKVYHDVPLLLLASSSHFSCS